MYYQNNRFGSGRNNNRFQRNSNRSFGRRQKTFDPTNVINNSAILNSIEHSKEEAFVPINTFDNFAVSAKLKENIIKIGYKIPTPIQDATIPELLNGRDLIGIAKTGSGKTAAFLIPLINKVLNNPNEKVLILAPTRELAVQIRDEFLKFSDGLNIYSVLCIGGVSMHGQVKILYRNPQFVIGTPGRLRDLERQHILNFNNFRNIVLDEVDHMFDMGFIDDVNYIVGKLPFNRQSLFFSATVNSKIEPLMRKVLKNPIKVEIASNAPATNIKQSLIHVDGKSKIDVLHELLVQKEFEKVLIFGRTKFGIEKLSKELIYRGFKAASIHGNKSQNQRQRALSDFKSDYIQILLATDIASRGLDINNVTHVINYDLPESYEDYIHRIGRTGRADKTGEAITFIA